MAARKNKSEAWKHFTNLSDMSIKCKLCEKELPTLDLLSMLIVESKSLQRHLEFFEPNFKLPCRQTMTARVVAKKNGLAKKIKGDLLSGSSVSNNGHLDQSHKGSLHEFMA